MKKLLAFALALALALSLFGCSVDAPDSSGVSQKGAIEDNAIDSGQNADSEDEAQKSTALVPGEVDGIDKDENNEDVESDQVDDIEVTNYTPDIRNVCFGDSIETVRVREKEGTLVKETTAELCYADLSVAGLSASLLYTFNENNELYRVGYVFTEPHTSDNRYIDDYQVVKKGLTEKYGDPVIDSMEWSRYLYKDTPDYYGFAVSIGDLLYMSIWNTDNMDILVGLRGDNYEINLTVLYKSTTIAEAANPDSGL